MASPWYDISSARAPFLISGRSDMASRTVTVRYGADVTRVTHPSNYIHNSKCDFHIIINTNKVAGLIIWYNKKAMLSQGNHMMQRDLPTPNQSLIVIYIYCIKADLNVKPVYNKVTTWCHMSTSLHWLGLRRGVFACVGWQVCDPIWQATPRRHRMLYSCTP